MEAGSAAIADPVDVAVDLWTVGDVKGAARLMRRARREAAERHDIDELAEIDSLVTTMRSTLSGDGRLATFETALAGRWRDKRRSGSGMRGRDYALCFVALPLASIPVGVVLLLVGDSLDYFQAVVIGLSSASGLWAGWRRSVWAGCAVGFGTYVLAWVSAGVALFVTWAALGGG